MTPYLIGGAIGAFPWVLWELAQWLERRRKPLKPTIPDPFISRRDR